MNANRFNILLDYIRSTHVSNFLEIGVFKGDTSANLIRHSKNPKISYTGIDLFEDMTPEILKKEQALQPDSYNAVNKKLKATRKTEVNLYKGYSKDILPLLLKNNVRYDLIFIDGGHSYDTLKTDFKYSLKLLKNGGRMFIDDYAEEESMKGVKIFVDELIKYQKHLNVNIRRDKRDNYRGFNYHLVEVTLTNNIIPIDVLASFNQEFFPMFSDIFLPSLPPKTTLYTRYIKGEVDKRFGVFYQKMEFVRDHIKDNKNLVFFLDADVVILNDGLLHELYYQYQSQGEPDLLMQWNQPEEEDDEKNIGVMLIKPSERVKQLYCKYCEADQDWIIEKHGFDQKYFAYLLRTEFKDLNVKILPFEFYGNQMKKHGIETNEMYLYHATFEPNFESKYNTLKTYFNKFDR